MSVGPNDWSWRIRFGAVQSMVKICRSLASDKNREGLRTAAWNILLRAHSLEKDDRVLEALKVGQVIIAILMSYFIITNGGVYFKIIIDGYIKIKE